jgi:hypothetical protein
MGCPCVLGNHDAHLLCPEQAHELQPWIAAATLWCMAQLSAADLDWLRSFLPRIEIPMGAGAWLCCYHGSPRSNEDRILATTPVSELDKMLAGYAAAVMAGGHNHVQMLRRHRASYVVDVGSVGQPMEELPFRGAPRYMPWAEYAIVSQAEGVLDVDLRRVPIDLEAVAQAAWESGMPDAGGWVRCWQEAEPWPPGS